MEDLVQFVKDLSPCLSKVWLWTFWILWRIFSFNIKYLSFHKNIVLVTFIWVEILVNCCFPPQQNDNCRHIEGRFSTNLLSCFERHSTCLFYNLIHLMGHRLLDLDWVVNLKCFLSGSFISCQKLWGEISSCSLLRRWNVEVSHDVEGRQKDLLNPSQRESLGQHLEQIKTLAPILICSMKIFIQILNQASKTSLLFGSNAQLD